jgi:hypothetical protein
LIDYYYYTSNNCSHWNSNKWFEEKSENRTRKTINTFTTKDTYSWKITHNTESIAVGNLKPERWGSSLVQEKYLGEKACEKRHYINNNNNNNNNNISTDQNQEKHVMKIRKTYRINK